MNKKELSIIKNNYKEVCYNVILFDTNDYALLKMSVRNMLLDLGLKDEVFKIENEVIAENKQYNIIQIEMFNMIYEDFKKYNQYIHFDLNEIETIYDNLKYEMTEEENRNYIARIKNIYY